MHAVFRLVAFTAVFAAANAVSEQCYRGVGGTNPGEHCAKTKLYADTEPESPDCSDRAKADCEAHASCTWHDDRGEEVNGKQVGECGNSQAFQDKEDAFNTKRGTECDKRIQSGCFENNTWLGENEDCTDQTDVATCNAVSSPTLPTGCKWIAPPTDLKEDCATKGEGTTPGMCEYNDGNSAPLPQVAKDGFKHGMFTKKTDAPFIDKCALVATFRPGKGSAVAFGADRVDIIGHNCKERIQGWRNLAEHIGHTNSSIDEYCKNFVPDTSAMETFKTHKPSAIIAAAKSGTFAELFPGFKDALFLVTSKPEYGECLFTSVEGQFGAAICTCDEAECNDQEALEFITDRELGPLRLLQFIDGSLLGMKDTINAVVAGLITANGKIDTDKVSAITEADVDALMEVPAISDLTNKKELLALAEDYKALLVSMGDGVPAGADAVAAKASLFAAAAAAAIALF